MSSPSIKKANYSIRVLGVGISSTDVAISSSQLDIITFTNNKRGIVTKELKVINRIDFFKRALHS